MHPAHANLQLVHDGVVNRQRAGHHKLQIVGNLYNARPELLIRQIMNSSTINEADANVE